MFRKPGRWAALITLLAVVISGCSSAQTVDHVVVISLDGSRPEFYMDSSWQAPHLQQLKAEGVYAAAGIRSVFPSVTYPSHTTLITGAYPARHGIYYNAPFGGKPGHWYWNESAIKCETLWDAVKEAGMRSGAVMWPVTVGAPIDYNFPVRRPEKGETADVLSIKYPYITPKSLLTDIEKKTGKKISPDDLRAHDYHQSKTIALISNYIIKTYKPNLMAIHFVGIDHVEHAHGTDGPELRDMVRVTDSLVGTVLEAIKAAGIEKTTAVIITGDHGHTDNRASFSPNVYLARHGWIMGEDKQAGWEARFQAAGGSAFLYLKDKNNHALLDSVVTVLENTDQYREGNFRILDRKTLDQMGANPEVSLGLAMKEGVVANNKSEGKPFALYHGPARSTHGYDPAYPSMHTTFIAAGAGIARHKNIDGMGIKDVAPLVARLLGLEFKAPGGKLIPGIVSE